MHQQPRCGERELVRAGEACSRECVEAEAEAEEGVSAEAEVEAEEGVSAGASARTGSRPRPRPAPGEVELTPAPDSTTCQPHRYGRGVADHAARFTCKHPVCGKAYSGPDPVRKHCRVDHPEWLHALGKVGPAGYCSWDVAAVRDSKAALKAARAEKQTERQAEEAAAARRHNSTEGWVT